MEGSAIPIRTIEQKENKQEEEGKKRTFLRKSAGFPLALSDF